MTTDAPAPLALNFRDTGPRDARLELLLVHAWGARLEFWDECAAVWEKRFRVVAVDLAGAGGSPMPERPRTRDEDAADLMAVREKLGLARVVPIGCAMGSLMTAGYAAIDAGHVAGLVLCDTAPSLGEASRERTIARAAAVRAGGMQAILPAAVDVAFEAQPRDERYRRYYEMFAANDPEGYASIALGMMGTDNSALLAALTCPTLIVAGGHDLLLPPDLSRQVHALMPGSEFALIEQAAHFPPAQTPEVFSELVLEFVDRRVNA
jgi:pimeloyl-ACP methyl ester carboxylesterase